MLNLYSDLLRYLLVSLPPRSLGPTLQTCRRFSQLTNDDKFYRHYWQTQLIRIPTLANYILSPKCGYGTWRELVTHKLTMMISLQPLMLVKGDMSLAFISIEEPSFRETIRTIVDRTDNVVRDEGDNVILSMTIDEILIDLYLHQSDLVNDIAIRLSDCFDSECRIRYSVDRHDLELTPACQKCRSRLSRN